MDTGTAKEQVSEVVDAAKQKTADQAGQAIDQGRSVLRTQVDQRSTMAGEQARSAAQTLRDTASQLRAEGDPQKARFAQVAEQGADRLERVGGYLTTADADELLGRVESIARRQPWLVAGAGLLLGIAAGRLMKASSSERYRASDGYRVAATPPVYAPRPATFDGEPTPVIPASTPAY
jgi:hypothetical protein